MDAARELAQLRERRREPHRELVDERSGLGSEIAARSTRSSSASATQLLLRAVVEVALDPAPGRRRRPRRSAGATRAAPRRARAGRPSGARCRSPATTAAAAASTSSGLVSSAASWTIAATRAPVALDRGPRAPRAGLGQLDRAAGLVDEAPRDRAASRRSTRERSPRLSASSSRTGPLAGGARRQQRARDRAQHAVERLERGDREHRGRRDAARAGRGRGPGRAATGRRSRSSPRPATPCTPRLRISASRTTGTSATTHRPAISSGGGQLRDHPPQRAVGEHVERAPPRAARRRDARRASAGSACPASGSRRAGRGARAAGRRPRRRAAAAARSRPRSARRRGRARATASAPRIAIGSVDDEVGDGVPTRAGGGGRGRAPRSRAAPPRRRTSPGAAQHLDGERRVGHARRGRGRSRSPDALSASTS